MVLGGKHGPPCSALTCTALGLPEPRRAHLALDVHHLLRDFTSGPDERHRMAWKCRIVAHLMIKCTCLRGEMQTRKAVSGEKCNRHGIEWQQLRWNEVKLPGSIYYFSIHSQGLSQLSGMNWPSRCLWQPKEQHGVDLKLWRHTNACNKDDRILCAKGW